MSAGEWRTDGTHMCCPQPAPRTAQQLAPARGWSSLVRLPKPKLIHPREMQPRLCPDSTQQDRLLNSTLYCCAPCRRRWVLWLGHCAAPFRARLPGQQALAFSCTSGACAATSSCGRRSKKGTGVWPDMSQIPWGNLLLDIVPSDTGLHRGQHGAPHLRPAAGPGDADPHRVHPRSPAQACLLPLQRMAVPASSCCTS